ncbi:N-methyl-L-tryptophan oxidase [Escherichia coli]|nr:N-methyl-L-tryptophan oxidase [Escherichia coli]
MKYDLIIMARFRRRCRRVLCNRAGLNVLMTDAHMPPHQHGSHHGDTRLIRHAYGEGEKYVPLVLRAQTLWDELSRHNEEDPIFVRSGSLTLARLIPHSRQRRPQRRTMATQR